MDKTKAVVDSSEIIYKEVLNQFQINDKSLDSTRDRANKILVFSGVILNLILLTTVQTFQSSFKPRLLIIILVLSAVFIFMSVLLTIPAITVKKIELPDPSELINDFKDESIRKTYLSLAESTANSTKQLLKKIKEANLYLKLSWICLIIGIFFVILFLVAYVILI